MKWQELEDEATSDLIEFVKFKEDSSYSVEAESAFNVLVFRFRKDLIDKCTIICRKWGYNDDLVAAELANRTFERYFQYPYTFDTTKCKGEDIDKCFLLYLYSIAQNELIRLYNTDDNPYDGTESIVTSLIDNEKDAEPEKLKELKAAEEFVDNALSKLSSKHKIIYLTYKKYELEGKKLPRKLLQELRDYLSLPQNTIRVYKHEANKAVEKELEKRKSGK